MTRCCGCCGWRCVTGFWIRSDLEMPGPRFMNAKTLVAAVKAGAVKEATIDDKVLRLLRVALRYGFLDQIGSGDAGAPIHECQDAGSRGQGRRCKGSDHR